MSKHEIPQAAVEAVKVEYHATPKGDVFAHERTPDCACGPYAVEREVKVWVHLALTVRGIDYRSQA